VRHRELVDPGARECDYWHGCSNVREFSRRLVRRLPSAVRS
jgi:hypothetical protein